MVLNYIFVGCPCAMAWSCFIPTKISFHKLCVYMHVVNKTKFQSNSCLDAMEVAGSRGDVFVVRTSKPVENLWKNGLFWSRYGFVTHSIDRKPRDWGLVRSAYSPFFYSAPRASVALRATAFGHPSGDVPWASKDMACGYWFSKVDLGQIRSEEIVYSRFIKIPLG